MTLVQLSDADGSWSRLKNGWAQQCANVGEDFGLYAQGTFVVLNELAAKSERRAGIYAVQRGDDIPDIICQANTTPLPGHPEPVLRVRMVTVCPNIDFGTFGPSQYVEVLADLFIGILQLSQQDEMAAREFKLHLRSPADFTFFQTTRKFLAAMPGFKDVSMHGAWLSVVRA